MWNGTGSQASCPKQESLYFGMMDVQGVTDELAVRSSDGSLTDPEKNGINDIMTRKMDNEMITCISL